MRLPRRVPWSSIEEIEQVCSWIYSDDNDIDSKVLAVKRLAAWKCITGLPHALESTLALLVAIIQDNDPALRTSYLSIRQSYATAIVRLVNGLVDPLQLGTYARSIASIANQLGIPLWLVELRHAATHEDLPSIELLREAAAQSMNWLLCNYFIPLTNPSTTTIPRKSSLRPLQPILKQYKALQKIATRDAWLKSRLKPDLAASLKDLERWISEAQVEANLAVGELDWNYVGYEQDSDMRERWALALFCDSLLERGALVPLSKKKRIFPENTFYPADFSISLWRPLLTHMQRLHVHFPSTLCNRIVATLLLTRHSDGNFDSTYNMCIARWAFWGVDQWDDSEGEMLRTELTTNILYVLGRDLNGLDEHNEAARILLQTLLSRNPELIAILDLISRPTSQEWSSDHISVMNERLHKLLSSGPHIKCNTTVSMNPGVLNFTQPAAGWRLLDKNYWKPSPIGVYTSQ